MKRQPCVSVIGWSGSGKTTLLVSLLPELKAKGLRVAALKHSSDEHVLLKPGSDTDRLVAAGAAWVGFASPRGLEVFLAGNPSQGIEGALATLAAQVDLVLIEGWKDGPFPKIEVWRAQLGPCLSQSRSDALAIVTDDEPTLELPQFRSRDIGGIAAFLTQWLKSKPIEGIQPGEVEIAKGVAEREVTRISPHRPTAYADSVAIEEPLEIRVADEPVAITMRTPGDDARLAVGFLFAEGIIQSIDDVGSVVHCGRPHDEGFGNVINVTAAPGVSLDVDRVQASRRGTLTTSACGVCGRRSVDDLLQRCGQVPLSTLIDYQLLRTATDHLKDAQRNFALTGGTHAAAALNADGVLLASFEDVGRHNAVDKVIGELLTRRVISGAGGLRPGYPVDEKLSPAVLVVSGRASFEIVQKATVARIPAIASVSAASSLAIDLARRSGITLAGFARAGEINVYAHPERIRRAQSGHVDSV